MKEILIKAYTAFNLGDDLFIKILCDRYPNVKFLLLNEKYINLKGLLHSNLKIKSFLKIRIRIINYIFRKLNISENIFLDLLCKKSDAIVNIGGSIFMQHTLENNYNYLLRQKEIRMNKNYYVLGANFGPYISEEFYLSHYEMFKKYKDICFRDRKSYNLFKELKNVRLASDIVFSLDVKNLKEKSEPDYILFSVIKPSIRSYLKDKDEEYYHKIKECIIEALKKKENVKLISFCKGEGDEEAIDKILKLLPEEYDSYITRYDYRGNLDEALKIIANSKYVVAARFHAMILGFIFEKPIYPIIYSKKMTNVLDDIGFTGTRGNFENLKEIKKENVYLNKVLEKNVLNYLIKDSENHFKKLDEYLF